MNIQRPLRRSFFSILSSISLSLSFSLLLRSSVWWNFTRLPRRPAPAGVEQIFGFWRMMKRCAVEKSSAYAAAACEEMIMMMGSVSVACPKPRRVALFYNGRIPPLRWHMHHDDSKDGSEPLGMMLTKGSEISGHQLASSPPYFCGSPPSRASNPLTQDAQFGRQNSTTSSAVAPSPVRKPAGGGGGRMMQFGPTTATVRIEGFDCLGRDGQSRSISAVA